MHPLAIPCIAMAAVNAAVGAYYLALYLGWPKVPEHLPFALLCFLIAAYDPTDRGAVLEYLRASGARGEVATGLLYLEETGSDMHEVENTTSVPLVDLPYEKLCPGSVKLEELQKEWW